MSLGKSKERKIAARLQAVDGQWELEFPSISTTGRVGHLSEERVPFDGLTKNYAMESKSSSSKAKNPGHRISKDSLQKIQKGSKKFDQRWLYAIDLPYCEIAHCISEEWHYRYMIAYEYMKEDLDLSEEELNEKLDNIAQNRIKENCSETYW